MYTEVLINNCSSSPSNLYLFLLALFGRLNRYKLLMEQEIVENFQPAGDEEGHIDPRRPGEHEPHKQGTDGGSRGSRHTGNARCRRSLFLAHHRHDVGPPGGNIHLADAESYQANKDG